jgi:hypothetical protein
MKIIKETLIVIIAGIIITGVLVFANTDISTPNQEPASTGVTLDDIYHKLNNTSPSTKDFNPTGGTDVSNFHDLGEIYIAIGTLDPATFTSSTTIMGIAGTYDVSGLDPSNVATGTTYGQNGSLVGTME